MNNIDKTYTNLLQDILDNGVKKETRNGGTISVFGRQIRHKMSEGFPLLTTKKMSWKTIVTELLWFLRGDTNIKYLVDNGCHIWDGDAYKNFEKWYNEHSGKEDYTGYYVPTKEEFIRLIKTDDEFAKKWGELGPIYGKQWRTWKVTTNDEQSPNYENTETSIDQIANLINELKTNPDSRRLMVNAWNVGELDQMVLPPCHYGFQCYTRELSIEERIVLLKKLAIFQERMFDNAKSEMIHGLADSHNIPTRAISLKWNQRSVDTFLGLPFNIASYGLLLEIIAKMVNMVPDELIGNLGDVHLYSNHIEQAKEQIGRELTLEERKQIFEDKGYVCDVWPFNGNWYGEYDGFGIPTRTREPYPLPTLNIVGYPDEYNHPNDERLFREFDVSDFLIENYQSHPTIKAPLSN